MDGELRKRVKNAIRALERSPSAAAPRMFDDIFGPWQSDESIQKVCGAWPSRRENEALGLALRYSKSRARHAGQKYGKSGPPRKKKNLDTFYQALREEFRAWMMEYRPRQSWSSHRKVTEFREKIRSHSPRRLRFFKKRLTKNGQGFLTVKRLSQILRPDLRAI